MHLNKAIESEKKALLLLLKLLILLCLIKTFFLIYNYSSNKGWNIDNYKEVLAIGGWALYYDAAMISLVSLPFFLVQIITKNNIVLKIAAGMSVTLTTIMLLLNIADIFYFPFHRQRADADLLYVLRNPLNYGGFAVLFIIVLVIIAAFVFAKIFWKTYSRIILEKRSRNLFTNLLLLTIIASLYTNAHKRLLPTAALTKVNATQLPLTQNSLHTFLYSLYRSKESIIPDNEYIPLAKQQQLFSIEQQNHNTSLTPKNIVLFIMESVPYEFFDSTSTYKPRLPFLDSLLQHSSFYNNAFSYSYNSNKGITAILTGLPTITDIPLYHSGFVNLNKTSIGNMLQAKNYRSSFFIGDNYDDFGFAKCCMWAGIQHYYCMEDIEGYKKMEKHSLGLHDEYMLNFMQQTLAKEQQPFFAIQYNISTHYPHDLPAAYKKKYKQLNIPASLKSMMYYDECLAKFFKQAQTTDWYKHTVFIFCSDHWSSPSATEIKNNMVNSFRIPIIIFDPSQNKAQTLTHTVSQLDVMNTILAYAGISGGYLSYGQSLLDSMRNNRTVFTKVNNSIYQAINNEYVIGFNADEGNAVYGYHFKTDTAFKNNLLQQNNAAVDTLIKNMKAFLQTATKHYKNKQ